VFIAEVASQDARGVAVGIAVEKAHEDGLAWHEGMEVLDSSDFDQAARGERGLSVHVDLERQGAAPLIPQSRPPFYSGTRSYLRAWNRCLVASLQVPVSGWR
jgi:hypothetical protein